jgi:thymidylate synthase
MNYLEIVETVYHYGEDKIPTRSAEGGRELTKTYATFCEVFRHHMSNGFPLSTLRKLPWKSIRVELEGFIKGITDKKWYQDRGCHFWDEWQNPQNNDPRDLGPIYGKQWRAFNKSFYMGKGEDEKFVPGELVGSDQLAKIVHTLKNNPTDRRMVCSAWNPNQMDLMALPPCHFAWYVSVIGGHLNLVWFQRSCDVALGLPANIASYGLLLELLAKEANLPAGQLVGVLADCHIYENQTEAILELFNRKEKELPKLKLTNDSIWDWDWSKAELIGYDPHPAIKMGEVEV